MPNENFEKQLKPIIKSSNLSQRAFAEKLGVPLRTLEDWLGGISTPTDFTKKAVLKKAKEIAQEIENEE